MAKTQASENEPGFIRHLLDVWTRQDRGALSELQRSLVSGNETLAARHVLPWLTPGVGRRRESLALLVAGLFATHPGEVTGGNFGNTMRCVWQKQERRPSTEQRFVTLLNAHSEDLPYYLRQAVGLARSEKVAVDWPQLYSDLCNWSLEDHFVQRKWARAFWRAPTEDQNQSAKKED